MADGRGGGQVRAFSHFFSFFSSSQGKFKIGFLSSLFFVVFVLNGDEGGRKFFFAVVSFSWI